ncbi:MAG TPA: DUF6167 family protein [Nocardioidaceae bacterium]|nr:DUF6167 family protein [Nocardioidaceae bacterium]
MSRMFWFTVGAGSGVYAVVKTRRAAERFTPSGLADQLAALGHGARLFSGQVREGMAEHETELRSRLELAHADRPDQTALPPTPEGAPDTSSPDTSSPGRTAAKRRGST